MNKSSNPKPINDWCKINQIAQAHLVPGVNLVIWQDILADYLDPDQPLDILTPIQVDEIIQRLDAIMIDNETHPTSSPRS